jgi:hypothetical protein
LALVRDFKLQANKWCKEVTTASEKWFLENPELDDAARRVFEPRSTLHGTKSGLLASLCCPTCDIPQLRLVTDFLTVLAISNSRTLFATVDGPGEWIEERVGGSGPPGGAEKTRRLGIANHRLFRQ